MMAMRLINAKPSKLLSLLLFPDPLGRKVTRVIKAIQELLDKKAHEV